MSRKYTFHYIMSRANSLLSSRPPRPAWPTSCPHEFVLGRTINRTARYMTNSSWLVLEEKWKAPPYPKHTQTVKELVMQDDRKGTCHAGSPRESWRWPVAVWSQQVTSCLYYAQPRSSLAVHVRIESVSIAGSRTAWLQCFRAGSRYENTPYFIRKKNVQG